MEPSFDTMTMPYLASPLSLGHMQGNDYLNSLPGLDLPDQRSNFDAETFIRCAPSLPNSSPPLLLLFATSAQTAQFAGFQNHCYIIF
jgi:hypothetical protein